jgi:hypothetical protein
MNADIHQGGNPCPSRFPRQEGALNPGVSLVTTCGSGKSGEAKCRMCREPCGASADAEKMKLSDTDWVGYDRDN